MNLKKSIVLAAALAPIAIKTAFAPPSAQSAPDQDQRLETLENCLQIFLSSVSTTTIEHTTSILSKEESHLLSLSYSELLKHIEQDSQRGTSASAAINLLNRSGDGAYTDIRNTGFEEEWQSLHAEFLQTGSSSLRKAEFSSRFVRFTDPAHTEAWLQFSESYLGRVFGDPTEGSDEPLVPRVVQLGEDSAEVAFSYPFVKGFGQPTLTVSDITFNNLKEKTGLPLDGSLELRPGELLNLGLVSLTEGEPFGEVGLSLSSDSGRSLTARATIKSDKALSAETLRKRLLDLEARIRVLEEQPTEQPTVMLGRAEARQTSEVQT
ncbi:MAG: hypothetical protein AAFY15_06230 [Cyanobacteria bacterium J06648_11]